MGDDDADVDDESRLRLDEDGSVAIEGERRIESMVGARVSLRNSDRALVRRKLSTWRRMVGVTAVAVLRGGSLGFSGSKRARPRRKRVATGDVDDGGKRRANDAKFRSVPEGCANGTRASSGAIVVYDRWCCRSASGSGNGT